MNESVTTGRRLVYTPESDVALTIGWCCALSAPCDHVMAETLCDWAIQEQQRHMRSLPDEVQRKMRLRGQTGPYTIRLDECPNRRPIFVEGF